MKIAKTIVLFLTLAVIAGTACSSLNGRKEADNIETKFKDISIQTATGKKLPLADYLKGFDPQKPVVMITWFKNCRECQKVIEKLVKEKDKNRAYELVALNIDKVGKNGTVSSKKQFEKMKKEITWNCNVIYDPTGSYARKFLEDAPTSTETFIILDGNVRYARKNSEYISYKNQDVLIKAALASRKAPVHGLFSHENGEPAVSYGIYHFKRSGTWTAHYKNGALK